MPNTEPLSLLTFPPMLDSELARRFLQHYGVAYRERGHMVGLAQIMAAIGGGGGIVPMLAGPGLNVTRPQGILDHFEAIAAPERRMIPADPTAHAQVLADWQQFNGPLGGYVAIKAYAALLPYPKAMIPVLCDRVPWLERQIVRIFYPIQRWLLASHLKLTPEGAAAALAGLRATFPQIDARIADGRRFLGGDTMTLADISLACIGAPFTLPNGYTAPIPPYDAMPPEMKSLIDEFRAHPTAALIQRVYDAMNAG
jgi:glutathione S-transferase